MAQLPIRTYWTTNYDKLLENALRERDKIVDVKSAVPQLATTRPGREATIFKMHGDVERPDEAVVTKDDYERYVKERGAFITALQGELVSKTLLFLGFSFTDPNLEHVLAQVRLTFTNNQRRHYAVFRARSKMDGESDADFEHYRNRQNLVFEDLKRFNVRVLLIDDYSEITEYLTELVSQYRRRTVFISASAANFDPWGHSAVTEFAQELGSALIADGTRIATGLDEQLKGCSVTAVPFGAETCNREWVKYEIEQSYKLKMGILAIDIHNVRDPLHGTDGQGRNSLEHWSINGRSFASIYQTYDWIRDDGYNNIAGWVERAARQADR